MQIDTIWMNVMMLIAVVEDYYQFFSPHKIPTRKVFSEILQN